MSITLTDPFNGSALTASWTTAHINAGAHSVSGGLLTLSTTAAGVARVDSASTFNWDDDERIVLNIGPRGSGGQLGMCVTKAGQSRFPGICDSGTAGRVFATQVNPSTGATGTSASHPTSTFFLFLGLRRSGTSIVFETSPDNVTWTSFYTEAAAVNWNAGLFTDCRVQLFINSSGVSSASIAEFNPGVLPPPPLVANELRFVGAPTEFEPGTPYTLTVEAIDTTQGDQRVTSFTDDVTLGIDVAVPVGYVISSGTLTRTAVAGVATFPGIVFAAAVTPPFPPPLPPVTTSPVRQVIFTSAALAAQVDLVNIASALVARVADLGGTTDTAYITPVQLVIKSGTGRVRGLTTVIPVAGIITVPANTVAVELEEFAGSSQVQLGFDNLPGVTPVFAVNRPAPAAPLRVGEELRVPEGAARAVVQITGAIAGGNIQLQGTVDGVNWSLVDATPYVSGAAASTFTAAFFGRADVTGMRNVRLIRSTTGVTFGTAIVTVTEA